MSRNIPSIIPLPANFNPLEGEFELSALTAIVHDSPNEQNAVYLREMLVAPTGFPLPLTTHTIESDTSIFLELIQTINNPVEESYRLIIKPKRVQIQAPTLRGVFYGIQSFRQLLPPQIENIHNKIDRQQVWRAPCFEIEDQPRFYWRGFMFDEGRHFHGIEEVRRLLDILALHKLNIFHWHLTEDQGWRIEIKRHPQLTEIGSKRTGTAQSMSDMLRKQHNRIPHSGFYTQEEIREIVNYAARRFITIEPEIDIPGHSMAALAAYPAYSCTGGPFSVGTRFGIYKDIYCPGKDQTLRFLEEVFDEVLSIFPSPYIHIGGDEAPKSRWKECPDCQRRIRELNIQDEHGLQNYLTNRMAHYLAERGRILVGWNEILHERLFENAMIQYWVGNRKGIAAAIQKGRKVVISSYLKYYLDHSYSLTPLRSAYLFEPIFPGLGASEAENIIGIEAPLWTEWVSTRERLDFQVNPRLSAIAETAWTPKAYKNYSSFEDRLSLLLQRFDHLGIGYAANNSTNPNRLKQLFGLFTIAQVQTQTATPRRLRPNVS